MSKIAEGKWMFLSVLLDATAFLKIYHLIQWQGDSHINKKHVLSSSFCIDFKFNFVSCSVAWKGTCLC